MIASTHLRARAELVAQQVAESRQFAAFPFDALIGILLDLVPVIVNGCFRPADGPEAARYVARRWRRSQADDLYGGYSRALVAHVSQQAREIASKKHGQTLDRIQAHELALRTLDSVRTGDTQQVSDILAEQEREFVPTVVSD